MTTDKVLGELGRISCVIGGRWLRWSARREMDDEQRNSAAWDEYKVSIDVLQKDMRGLSNVQATMGHEIVSFVTGLQEAMEGLAEVRAHMPGQFWASMRGAGRMPLATTGAVLHPTTSDVASDVASDAESVCRIQTRLQLLEEAHEVCEDGLQAEAARCGMLIARMDRMAGEVDALR